LSWDHSPTLKAPAIFHTMQRPPGMASTTSSLNEQRAAVAVALQQVQESNQTHGAFSNSPMKQAQESNQTHNNNSSPESSDETRNFNSSPFEFDNSPKTDVNPRSSDENKTRSYSGDASDTIVDELVTQALEHVLNPTSRDENKDDNTRKPPSRPSHQELQQKIKTSSLKRPVIDTGDSEKVSPLSYDYYSPISKAPATFHTMQRPPGMAFTTSSLNERRRAAVAAALLQVQESNQTHGAFASSQVKQAQEANQTHNNNSSPEYSDETRNFNSSPVKSDNSPSTDDAPMSDNAVLNPTSSDENKTRSHSGNASDTIVGELVTQALKYAQDAKESHHTLFTTGNIPRFHSANSLSSYTSEDGLSAHSNYSTDSPESQKDVPWYAC